MLQKKGFVGRGLKVALNMAEPIALKTQTVALLSYFLTRNGNYVFSAFHVPNTKFSYARVAVPEGTSPLDPVNTFVDWSCSRGLVWASL